MIKFRNNIKCLSIAPCKVIAFNILYFWYDIFASFPDSLSMVIVLPTIAIAKVVTLPHSKSNYFKGSNSEKSNSAKMYNFISKIPSLQCYFV